MWHLILESLLVQRVLDHRDPHLLGPPLRPDPQSYSALRFLRTTRTRGRAYPCGVGHSDVHRVGACLRLPHMSLTPNLTNTTKTGSTGRTGPRHKTGGIEKLAASRQKPSETDHRAPHLNAPLFSKS